MNISEYNRFIQYYFNEEKAGITKEEEKRFENFISENKSFLYSRLFFEYTQIEIDDRSAHIFLRDVIENKKAMEKYLQAEVDFRVAFLDYLIRNIKKITEVSEPRIIEDKIFRNLNQLIVRDGLTGLYNFRHYENELEKEFARASRHRHVFSLVIMDIDNFKLYNDRFGHLEGNMVLKEIAGIIFESTRKSDVPCRYGGEEFTIILPQTDKKGAYILSEKIRESVARKPFKMQVTISGGLAEYPGDTDKPDRTLFEYADKALYYSKEKGKNLITRFSHKLL